MVIDVNDKELLDLTKLQILGQIGVAMLRNNIKEALIVNSLKGDTQLTSVSPLVQQVAEECVERNPIDE